MGDFHPIKIESIKKNIENIKIQDDFPQHFYLYKGVLHWNS